MGLKAGLNLLQQTGKVATGYVDDAARVFCRIAKPITPTELKSLRFASDAVGDCLTRSLQAKVFTNFSKKIAGVQSSDDLTILAQEFKKLDLDDVMRQELISQYVSKYESFYNQLYTGKTFEPRVLFKQIFGKDLSEEAAQTLCSKYKEILSEPDFNKFLEQLHIQVKKDFGLDYIDSRLELIPQNGIAFSMGSSKFLDFIKVRFFKDNPTNRRKAFELMMHEVNHMRQTEISIAVNPCEYVKAIQKQSNKTLKEIVKQFDSSKNRAIQKKYGEITIDSPLYNRGMAYIESTGNYFSPRDNFTAERFLAYKKQLIEAESYAVQDRAGELFYFLTGNAI